MELLGSGKIWSLGVTTKRANLSRGILPTSSRGVLSHLSTHWNHELGAVEAMWHHDLSLRFLRASPTNTIAAPCSCRLGGRRRRIGGPRRHPGFVSLENHREHYSAETDRKKQDFILPPQTHVSIRADSIVRRQILIRRSEKDTHSRGQRFRRVGRPTGKASLI